MTFKKGKKITFRVQQHKIMMKLKKIFLSGLDPNFQELHLDHSTGSNIQGIMEKQS